jgi:hypothetical protein
MSILKKFGVLAVAVFAISVVAVASASAAPKFTASATGTLAGTQTSNQVFTASSGGTEVVCKEAATSGEITETEATSQMVTVTYENCHIPSLFNASVNMITATYDLHANGTVKITGTIKLEVPSLGCTTTVSEQEVGTATYDTASPVPAGDIEQTSAITGIHSTSTGLCPSGTTGTYTGNNLVHRVGGGTLGWDA